MHTVAQKASQAFIAALLTWVSSKFRQQSPVIAALHCPAEVHVMIQNRVTQLTGDIAHGCFQQTFLSLK